MEQTEIRCNEKLTIIRPAAAVILLAAIAVTGAAPGTGQLYQFLRYLVYGGLIMQGTVPDGE